MSDSQNARDYANQNIYNIDNYHEHKHYDIEGQEAESYLIQLFDKNFPKLQNVAMSAAAKSAEGFTRAVLAGVTEIDPDLVDEFRRPDIQSAFLSAQQGYAETADPDSGTGDLPLGHLLSRLVIKLVRSSNRTFNNVMLKRAIAIAPHLTRQQINSLSVLSVFNTCGFNGSDPDSILTSMDVFFRAYYGDVATEHLEYSYMEASGVGSNLFGADAYEAICKRHRVAMRKTFDLKDLPSEVDADTVKRFIQVSESDPQRGCLREESLDELFGNDRSFDFAASIGKGKSERELIMFAGKSLTSPQELGQLAQGSFPALHDFITKMESAGAFHFQINTIGYILAKQELDLRFPGNTILTAVLPAEPLIESATSADAEDGQRSER